MARILDLPHLVARLGETDRAIFERLFAVSVIEGSCACPENFPLEIAQQFGSRSHIESQTILRVQNLYTYEGALFNPLRSARPTSRSDRDVLDALHSPDDRKGSCSFCRQEEMLPIDPFGRIRGTHCVTASNAAKYDGKHGLVVFTEHHPLRFSREAIRDAFVVATKWFAKAADPAHGFNYPFLMWNCRWRAGASVEHGHLHVTMGKDRPYPKLLALQTARQRYRDTYSAEYFADLFRVHEQLGLGFQRGHIKLFASLCPFRDRETILMSESLDDELADLVYDVLDTARTRASLQAFNLGVLFPPIKQQTEWQAFPVIVRIIDRLSVTELPSDISGMSIFAGADAIATDPYEVIALLATHCGASA